VEGKGGDHWFCISSLRHGLDDKRIVEDILLQALARQEVLKLRTRVQPGKDKKD
jgi:hypothetical protein